MKISVVRHAETNFNVLGLHNADPSVDVRLTEQGIKQAESLAKELKDMEFETIIISELLRTKQTADIINKFHYSKIEVDARLNDIDSGFEGQLVSDYHEARDASPDPYTARFNNGESPNDVYDRTKEFLKSLPNRSEKSILIVTSKHNFRHIKSIIHNLDPREALKTHIENAEKFEFES